jgi:hypothetical protein
MGAGTKAKTMTSPLIIPSVLQVVVLEFVMVTSLSGYHDIIILNK